jgi:protein-disulfide isomerase
VPSSPLTALALAFLLALAACATAAPPPGAPTAAGASDVPGDTVVLEMAGARLTLAEVDALAADKLDRERADYARKVEEIRQETLDRWVDRRLLLVEAQRRGLASADDLIRLVVDEQTPQPSDADLQTFYDDNKDQMRGATLEEIRDRLREFLHDEAKQKRFAALLGGLRATAKVVTRLPQSRVKVAATGPARGPADAPVAVVIFSDFQCPYCSRAVAALDKVVETYGPKVRVVFRDFPLEFHPHASKAAEAGKCAAEQGKFWALHDRMFAKQDDLGVESLKVHARTIAGLDGAAFDACLTSGKMAGQVAADLAAGQAAGVSGTPAFFINGVMLTGAQPFEAFKALIDRELAAVERR